MKFTLILNYSFANVLTHSSVKLSLIVSSNHPIYIKVTKFLNVNFCQTFWQILNSNLLKIVKLFPWAKCDSQMKTKLKQENLFRFAIRKSRFTEKDRELAKNGSNVKLKMQQLRDFWEAKKARKTLHHIKMLSISNFLKKLLRLIWAKNKLKTLQIIKFWNFCALPSSAKQKS